MKHVFLCFVLLFLGSTTAVWGETLSELQQRAESGDSDAQYDLAMRYWEGKEGAPKDDSKAFYWAKKAAEQGNAYAQSWVGYFYENAYGTARDFGEAAYWYRRSADQGNRFSQNNLGECYYYGRGVERSYEKAVLWYKKAADTIVFSGGNIPYWQAAFRFFNDSRQSVQNGNSDPHSGPPGRPPPSPGLPPH